MVSRNHRLDLNLSSLWAEDQVANYFVGSCQCVNMKQKSEGTLSGVLEHYYLLTFLKPYMFKKKLVLFAYSFIDLETE